MPQIYFIISIYRPFYLFNSHLGCGHCTTNWTRHSSSSSTSDSCGDTKSIEEHFQCHYEHLSNGRHAFAVRGTHLLLTAVIRPLPCSQQLDALILSLLIPQIPLRMTTYVISTKCFHHDFNNLIIVWLRDHRYHSDHSFYLRYITSHHLSLFTSISYRLSLYLYLYLLIFPPLSFSLILSFPLPLSFTFSLCLYLLTSHPPIYFHLHLTGPTYGGIPAAGRRGWWPDTRHSSATAAVRYEYAG